MKLWFGRNGGAIATCLLISWSTDGDGAAAQRYTEARSDVLLLRCFRDINKNTVDFIVDNYDGQ